MPDTAQKYVISGSLITDRRSAHFCAKDRIRIFGLIPLQRHHNQSSPGLPVSEGRAVLF